MRNLLFIFSFCLLLCACSTDRFSNESLSTQMIGQDFDGLSVNEVTVSIDMEEAKYVAWLFKCRRDLSGNGGRSVDGIENTVVQTVVDSVSGNPLLYIVNWENNQGFVVVSASKKTYPIFAFSDIGYLNTESANSAAISYLEGYKSQIRQANEDLSDSLLVKHSLEWALYEQPALSFESRGVTDDFIQEEINRKTALGYTYIGTISALRYYLPEEEYQTVVRDISSHTASGYDYEKVSLFFIKSYDYEKIGPLMGTQWHQGSPFNVDAPNGLAGCVPVAVAQIAYYHKYPSTYQWDQIYKNPVLNEAFKTFILDIRNFCNVDYKEDGTGASYDDAYNAFGKLGYKAVKGGVPNAEKLRTEIRANSPVVIFGDNSDRGKGHTWVCEGYWNRKLHAVLSIISQEPLARSASLYSDYPLLVNAPSDENYGEFFYMNFGWKETTQRELDGWYRANSYIPSDPDHSYLTDQKIITVKK